MASLEYLLSSFLLLMVLDSTHNYFSFLQALIFAFIALGLFLFMETITFLLFTIVMCGLIYWGSCVNSRMGHHRMCFKPYSREQMVQIIKGRLEGIPAVFNELSIKLAAAKVALHGCSGCKILHICSVEM